MAMETRARTAKGLGSPLGDVVVSQKIMINPLRVPRDSLIKTRKVRAQSLEEQQRKSKRDCVNDAKVMSSDMSFTPPTKDQERRMELIQTALKLWKENPVQVSQLFVVETWMGLIWKAVKGTTDARKYKNDDRRKKFATVVIEQIASRAYQRRVADILCASLSRGSQKVEAATISREFLHLCNVYEARMTRRTFRRCLGEDSSSPIKEEDSSVELENSRASSGGFVTDDDSDRRDDRILNASEFSKLTDNEEEESECEEKENSNHESRSQKGIGRMDPVYQPDSRETKNQTKKNKVQSRRIDTRKVSTQKRLKDFREKDTPIILLDHLNVASVPTNTSTRVLNAEDEIIENDTPPATPLLIDSANDGPSPEKKSRRSSGDMQAALETTRLMGYSVIGNTGMIDRTAGEFDYIKAAESLENDLFMDELPTKGVECKYPPVDQDKENLPKSVEEIARSYPKPPCCPELTPAMFQELKEALAKPKEEKLGTAFGMTIKAEHLSIYDKPEWLEDANIDFYLELIKARNNVDGVNYPKLFTFQCYFYKLLEKRGFDAIKGATEDTNIFLCDLVMIPIHSNHHWVLVVVDTHEKTLDCYDSMDHNNSKHIDYIREYLLDEWARLKKSTTKEKKALQLFRNPPFVDGVDHDTIWENSGWQTHDYGANDLPQQKNSRDCGIFLLQYAEYLSRRKPFDFEQKHTSYFRKRMMYETLKQSLLIT